MANDKSLTVRLPAGLYGLIEQRAAMEGRSVSAMARILLEKGTVDTIRGLPGKPKRKGAKVAAVAALAILGAASVHAQSLPFQERSNDPRRVCIMGRSPIDHAPMPFCGPAENMVMHGPQLACIRVGTGEVCPVAPQSAYTRRLQDAVAGRDGASSPTQLALQWDLCNVNGWNDTAACNRLFPDVRNPREVAP